MAGIGIKAGTAVAEVVVGDWAGDVADERSGGGEG